jgi:hypothetical protein
MFPQSYKVQPKPLKEQRNQGRIKNKEGGEGKRFQRYFNIVQNSWIMQHSCFFPKSMATTVRPLNYL